MTLKPLNNKLELPFKLPPSLVQLNRSVTLRYIHNPNLEESDLPLIIFNLVKLPSVAMLYQLIPF